jgi:hypothetical protein
MIAERFRSTRPAGTNYDPEGLLTKSMNPTSARCPNALT